MIDSASTQSSSCRKRARTGASLNCRVLGRRHSKSSANLSRNAPRTPARFSSDKSRLKQKHCVPILQRTTRLTGRYRRKLSAPKGNRARFGFPGGDKKARSDHGVLCFASARRINHCARTDEIECATSFWSAVLTTRRISVCARVFHRKQGTQYRATQP